MEEEVYKFLIKNGFSSKEAKEYIKNVKELIKLFEALKRITKERESEIPLGQWLDY